MEGASIGLRVVILNCSSYYAKRSMNAVELGLIPMPTFAIIYTQRITTAEGDARNMFERRMINQNIPFTHVQKASEGMLGLAFNIRNNSVVAAAPLTYRLAAGSGAACRASMQCLATAAAPECGQPLECPCHRRSEMNAKLTLYSLADAISQFF